METEEDRIEYVRNHISTQYHVIGTATMAPGEVVDDHLRVHGVKGLRVVDASIFPGHVSGNIMATTYAVAGKLIIQILRSSLTNTLCRERSRFDQRG